MIIDSDQVAPPLNLQPAPPVMSKPKIPALGLKGLAPSMQGGGIGPTKEEAPQL